MVHILTCILRPSMPARCPSSTVFVAYTCEVETQTIYTLMPRSVVWCALLCAHNILHTESNMCICSKKHAQQRLRSAEHTATQPPEQPNIASLGLFVLCAWHCKHHRTQVYHTNTTHHTRYTHIYGARCARAGSFLAIFAYVVYMNILWLCYMCLAGWLVLLNWFCV